MVPVHPVHSAGCLLHELPANVRYLAGAILPLQRFRNSAGLLRRHIPQVGRPRPLHRTGVRHIKDIFQAGPSAAALFDEGNPSGPRLDPPPHGLVPQLHTGTGGSVRPLGVDQELVVKGIFVEPGGGGQILLPASRIPRDGTGGLVRQLGHELQFTRHEALHFVKK
ncbi:hypothetical protein D1159_14985 [Pseudoflavonifractor sp. 524-17]|nr:hypothetical protein [Pseudoflavonifractor sp. 524-17]